MKPQLVPLLLGSCLLLGALGCGPGAPSTSLTDAAQKGYLNVVQKHIAAKTDLNTVDKNGWTALHLAAMRGDLPMVKALCTAGANAAATGPGGKTPLDLAREKRQGPVAQFLQAQAQAQAQSQNRSGKGGGRGLVDGGLGVSSVLDSQ